MEKADLVFNSYNKVVENSYNNALMNDGSRNGMKIREADVAVYLNRDLDKWVDTSMSELDGLTPGQFFSNLADFDHVVDLVKLGARICDQGLPEPLVDKLMSYGDRGVDALLELAADSRLQGEEDIYIPQMAVRILGRRRVTRAVKCLLELMGSLDEEKEILVEEITDALINIGELSIDALIDRLNENEKIGYIDEYLLTALVKVGRSNKSDKIFSCIKSTFLKMDDKILGAMCMGDYGDGRAIPALKGYAEKNRDKIDRDTYVEIKAAVRRLGGSIDDMNLKF